MRGYTKNIKHVSLGIVIVLNGQNIFRTLQYGNDFSFDKILQINFSIKILYTNELDRGPFICNTLDRDSTTDQDTALIEIYRMMRPGEPPTKDAATQLFTNLFQSPERYDLSSVGRMKFDSRVGKAKKGNGKTAH